MSDTPGRRAAGGDPVSGDSASSIKHRPSWIAFVVLGAIFCLGMGAWQLARYQEASGTVQNLGYTFMWPFLAGFLVYAYLKYVRLEADEADLLSEAAQDPAAEGVGEAEGVSAGTARDGDDDNAHPGAHTPAARPRTRSAARTRASGRGRRRDPVMTEIPADLLPKRRPTMDAEVRDEGLAAYNSYLAELARQDGVGDRSQEKPAS